jgi:hypothetical protein
MTNHTGTVSMLFYEAATGQVHELNSMGTIVPDLAPFHLVPGGKGLYASPGDAWPLRRDPGLHAGHEGDVRALCHQVVGAAVRACRALRGGGSRRPSSTW